MLKILLASHGNLCLGMLETLQLFTQETRHLQAIPFYTEDPERNPAAAVEDFIRRLQETDTAIVLTDILWGSVNQQLMMKLNDKPQVHLITGLNLPLLLELVTMNPESINPETIAEKVNACRDSIVYMHQYAIENLDGDE